MTAADVALIVSWFGVALAIASLFGLFARRGRGDDR